KVSVVTIRPMNPETNRGMRRKADRAPDHATVRPTSPGDIPEKAVRSARVVASPASSAFAAHEVEAMHANRNSEVVQRRQGLRVIHTGGRLKGRLRPPQRHSRRGFKAPARGRKGELRARGGPEGPRRGERPADLVEAP